MFLDARPPTAPAQDSQPAPPVSPFGLEITQSFLILRLLHWQRGYRGRRTAKKSPTDELLRPHSLPLNFKHHSFCARSTVPAPRCSLGSSSSDSRLGWAKTAKRMAAALGLGAAGHGRAKAERPRLWFNKTIILLSIHYLPPRPKERRVKTGAFPGTGAAMRTGESGKAEAKQALHR